MTNLERLHFHLIEAVKRTSAGQYKKVSAALIQVLPALVQSLTDVVADSSTTPGQRLQAAEMLMTMLARCIRDDYKRERVTVVKERTKAARLKAATDERKHKQVTAIEQRRIAKTLAKAQEEMNGYDRITSNR